MPVIIIAIILGIVEGLTEFLPVSSTGHLIIAGHFLGFVLQNADTFEIFIQSGAILAAAFLYKDVFINLFRSPATGVEQERALYGFAGIKKIAVASFPVLIAGFLFHKAIKHYLFGTTPVAAALILGGIVLILIERRRSAPTVTRAAEISLQQCLIIGLFQCVALWPGVSRSGATIVGAMLVGVSRQAAAEFSFIVAVPVMAAATGFDLLKSLDRLSSADIVPFAIGFVVSFLIAIVAIKGLIGYLSRSSLAPFGYYRIALAVVVLAVLGAA